MINKQIIILLLVTITMLSITQMFGMSKDNKEHPYMPRQINLSGNYVNFSMPENFSTDFPANDLVEIVNINNEKAFEINNSIELMRRWWDFKDNSFIAKDVGSMMMSIHVNEVLDTSRDISSPVEFIQVILLDMAKRDDEENKGKSEETKTHYPEDLQSFVERKYNKQRWISSGSGTFDEITKVFHFWIPVTEKNYLSIEFNFAPNNNISMRPFIDEYCREMMRKIMGTFDIIYSSENTIKSKLEKSSQLKLEQLIKELE